MTETPGPTQGSAIVQLGQQGWLQFAAVVDLGDDFITDDKAVADESINLKNIF